MKKAAGTLLYREGPEGLEVLLVHPSGWYNKKKPWGIPKGEPNAGETEMEYTARRETLEETGIQAEKLHPIGTARYKATGKVIHGFVGPAPDGAEPRCASWEIDQACFLPLDEARRRIHPDQAVFLDRLVEYLATR
ncbi:MAG: NUDIX domain-containing protein [Gemmataceae bacterium]